MTDYFTTDPVTGSPGKALKVCFDFVAAKISGPIDVKLDWGPTSVPDVTVSLSATTPCATVTVPTTATSLIVVDSSGTSEDHAVVIS